MIYKLSYKDRATWLANRDEAFTEPEEGFPEKSTYTLEGATIVEIGHIPIPATFDEEGELLTEAGLQPDYAVDICSLKVIEEVIPYSLPKRKAKYAHGFTNNHPVVVSTPTDKWLVDDIKIWLSNNGIEYDSSMLKAELLNLV